MPVFYLLSSDVVRDGEALFGVVNKVIEVLYMVVAHGGVNFFPVQDCAEGSGEASGVGSCSVSIGIIGRPDNILFQDSGVPKIGGRRVAWWQAGGLDDGVGKADMSWFRPPSCVYLQGCGSHAVWQHPWRWTPHTAWRHPWRCSPHAVWRHPWRYARHAA